MKNRKLLLDCTMTSLLENTVESQFNLIGKRQDNGNVVYEEAPGVTVCLALQKEGLTIERKGENHTQIVCCPNQRTEASMKTEYGEFHFQVETDYVHIEAEQIEIQYRLTQNETVVNHVRFCWKLKEEHE